MSTRNAPQVHRLAIPSIPERITHVDDFLESILREAGVAEDVVSDVAIATTEVVNNAINHGNAGDPGKTVHIEVAIGRAQITIMVADEGGGFNPDAVPDPLAKENLLREVGRGIFIVRHLMDDVAIESTTDRGTTVRMTKKVTPMPA